MLNLLILDVAEEIEHGAGIWMLDPHWDDVETRANNALKTFNWGVSSGDHVTENNISGSCRMGENQGPCCFYERGMSNIVICE
jgi:hypothetical protein